MASSSTTHESESVPPVIVTGAVAEPGEPGGECREEGVGVVQPSVVASEGKYLLMAWNADDHGHHEAGSRFEHRSVKF